MTTSYQPGPNGEEPAKPPRKKGKVVLIVVIAIAAAVGLLCIIGGTLAFHGSPSGKIVKVPSYGTTPPTARPTRPATSASAGTGITLPAAPVKAAPVTIGEGVWEVGSDVKAGKYKLLTSPQAGDNCYWEITRDDAGQDIVSNDLPTGGHPQVTLKKGQYFHTQDCGTWTLIK